MEQIRVVFAAIQHALDTNPDLTDEDIAQMLDDAFVFKSEKAEEKDYGRFLAAIKFVRLLRSTVPLLLVRQ